MEIHGHEQGSLAWHKSRLGIPSASAMKQLFTASHGLPKGVTKIILTYAAQLAADRHSGLPLNSTEGFQGSWATDRGNELEPVARNQYSFTQNVNVAQTGFITNKGSGCSPDGLVGDDGGLEIKCLLATAHTKAVADCIAGVCPADYYVQIQTSMWVTDRAWWDLYLYHPDLPSMDFRVEADLEFFKLLDQQVALVIGERDRLIAALVTAATPKEVK